MVDVATTSVEVCKHCDTRHSVVMVTFEPNRIRIKSYGYAPERQYSCHECGRSLPLHDHSKPDGYLVTHHLQRIE
jgi:hypothetical protein